MSLSALSLAGHTRARPARSLAVSVPVRLARVVFLW